MLTQEQNDRLCRIGPRTPMGELFRRYWMPITTADKVREPGSVMAARLLGEDFVVFRGKDGTLGVLDEFCIDRGASLAWGVWKNAVFAVSTTAGSLARTARSRTL
ncbi:phenylpropionate dioxygenase-like ring-hydroxylating dioxygenase large terminal subunit [Bradyrhizobium diazoefficiens]